MIKKFLIIGCLGLISKLSFANSVDDMDWITQTSKPFSYVDKTSHKKEGIAIDILDSILKKLGSKKTREDIVFEVYARAFLAIENNPNSAFFPIAKLPENEPKFKWVGPIVRYKPVLFAKKNKNIKINSYEDLNKYIIGAKTKASPSKLMKKLGISDNVIAFAKTDEDNFKKLEANHVDLVACGDMAGFSLIKDLGYASTNYEIVYRLSESDLAIAFHHKTSDEVISKLQKALDEMKKSNNGQPSEYEGILKKYQ